MTTYTIAASRFPRPIYRTPSVTTERRVTPTDDGGTVIEVAVVSIPLPDGRTALIDLDDFNHAMERGGSDQCWMHTNGHGGSYVRTTLAGQPGVTVPLARLALDVPRGTHARYINKNPLDLRRSNIRFTESPFKAPGSDATADADNGEF